VTVFLRVNARLKKLKFDRGFSEIAMRGRGAGGNLVSKHAIRKIELSEEGVSTLGARKVWYDETVRTLNADGRGKLLGEFMADDRIVVFLSSGEYLFTGFDLNTRFDDKMIHLEKWHPERAVSVVYFEGEKEDWYVKRFHAELTQKPFSFIGEHENSRLGVLSTAHHPMVRIRFNRRFKETRDREDETFDASDFIAVKGARALGNKLSPLPVTEVMLDPLNEDLEARAEEAWKERHHAAPKTIEEASEVAEEVSDESATESKSTESPNKTDSNSQPEPDSRNTDDASNKSSGRNNTTQATLF